MDQVTLPNKTFGVVAQLVEQRTFKATGHFLENVENGVCSIITGDRCKPRLTGKLNVAMVAGFSSATLWRHRRALAATTVLALKAPAFPSSRGINPLQ